MKGRERNALANVITQMTSVMALDGVTSFSRLKDVTNICKRRRLSPTIGGMAESWKKLNASNAFFVVYCVLVSK